MQVWKISLPVLGLGLVAALCVPDTSVSYQLHGFGLPQGQRDFRVFNNFSDPNANSNTTANPNFPGYTGAAMAIWKGVAEWGSVKHGDGLGDPTHADGIGSGGANFDSTFQGYADSVGAINDNTFSELVSSSMGTLTQVELVDSFGWRARFFSSQKWSDSPGLVSGGSFDIQSAALRMYGNALGLDNAIFLPGAMGGSLFPNNVSKRSIRADDRAGLQAIYGAISPTKPRITGYSISGSTVTVKGVNFDATDNEIWFTQAGTGGDGTPIKATGLTSNGTTLIAQVPATAGPGDILVRRNDTSYAGLSNAWPFDPVNGPACGVTQFGQLLGGANFAKLNGVGTGALGSSLTMQLSGFTPGTTGQMAASLSNPAIPFAGGGFLIDVFNPVATFGFVAPTGTATINVSIPSNPAFAYLPVYFQAGGPDATQVQGWALSNGVRLVICP